MNEGAEMTIVGNLVAYHIGDPFNHGPPKKGAGRVLHELVYKRTGTNPAILDPDVRRLEGILERYQAAPKRRIRSKRPWP